MKILYIVPSLPYPPRTGNTLIIYHHIKGLAARHSVDLVSFTGYETAEDLREMLRWCGRVHMVDRPARSRVVLSQAVGFVTGQPVYVSGHSSAPMAEAVDRCLRTGQYDVAVFHKTEMAQFRPDWYTGASILSMENPMVVNHQRLMESASSWLTRMRFRDRIARLTRYERFQVSRFDRVLLINEADAHDCHQILGSARIDWVPHGVDVDPFTASGFAARDAGMIVITGNMYHPPNVTAVDHFCREIFPRISRRVPSARLWLVGARPAPSVLKWAEDPLITVTGFVPDVRPYLTRARVSVCNVRLRIGTQTKVLEALASGTPVVTTAAGNHGIGAESGTHLYVADDAEEIADRVMALLRGEKWDLLSENGRRFVVDNFSWQKGVAKLEGILQDVRKQVAA
jgi:polysaccharide biosynthesis protein PslH